MHASRRAMAAAFALTVAACGSGSSKKTVTRSDFIAQADGICGTYNDLASNATKNLKHPPARRAATMVQTRLVPLYEHRNDELAHLTPPADDAATVAQIFADMKAATDEMTLDPAAFVGAHGATVVARKAAAEAAAYGFAVCGHL